MNADLTICTRYKKSLVISGVKPEEHARSIYKQ